MYYLKIFFTYSILSFFLLSCNTHRNDKSEPDGLRKVMLGENNLDFEYWLGSSENSSDKESYHLYIRNDSLDNQNFTSSGFYNIRFPHLLKNIRAITFYTDTIFNEESVTLISDKILGVQVHYQKDNYLKTDVFTYKNEQLQKIKNLTSFVEYFSFNDIHSCSEIFKSDRKSVFILFNNDMNQKFKKGKADFKKHLSAYEK